MRIAVFGADMEDTSRICRKIQTYADERHMNAEISTFASDGEFQRAFAPGRFRGAVVGCGDSKGFLCARRVREEDRDCRVILIDDTDRYAIRGMRIHLTDYLLRPVGDERFRVAMDRLFA
jgi:DNA-binding LytR/AlgR family response regulator